MKKYKNHAPPYTIGGYLPTLFKPSEYCCTLIVNSSQQTSYLRNKLNLFNLL